jgi:hypothetical protein
MESSVGDQISPADCGDGSAFSHAVDQWLVGKLAATSESWAMLLHRPVTSQGCVGLNWVPAGMRARS